MKHCKFCGHTYAGHIKMANHMECQRFMAEHEKNIPAEPEIHPCESLPNDQTIVYLAPLTQQWCVQQGDDESGDRVVGISFCPFCNEDLI